MHECTCGGAARRRDANEALLDAALEFSIARIDNLERRLARTVASRIVASVLDAPLVSADMFNRSLYLLHDQPPLRIRCGRHGIGGTGFETGPNLRPARRDYFFEHRFHLEFHLFRLEDYLHVRLWILLHYTILRADPERSDLAFAARQGLVGVDDLPVWTRDISSQVTTQLVRPVEVPASDVDPAVELRLRHSSP